jgi:hypothetical protein
MERPGLDALSTEAARRLRCSGRASCDREPRSVQGWSGLIFGWKTYASTDLSPVNRRSATGPRAAGLVSARVADLQCAQVRSFPSRSRRPRSRTVRIRGNISGFDGCYWVVKGLAAFGASAKVDLASGSMSLGEFPVRGRHRISSAMENGRSVIRCFRVSLRQG